MSTLVVNTHDAKSRLSELIRAAEDGDEVIVARNGKPVARIVAWSPAAPSRQPGAWEGRIELPDDLIGSDPDIVEMFETSARSSQD